MKKIYLSMIPYQLKEQTILEIKQETMQRNNEKTKRLFDDLTIE
jgi:hypothetical protein